MQIPQGKKESQRTKKDSVQMGHKIKQSGCTGNKFILEGSQTSDIVNDFEILEQYILISLIN